MTTLSSGILEISVGKTTIQLEVHICDHIGHEEILGNDYLYLLGTKITVKDRCLELQGQPVVQCLAAANIVHIHEVNTESTLEFFAIEAIPLGPIARGKSVLFPLTKSTVISAQTARTVILPVKCSHSRYTGL